MLEQIKQTEAAGRPLTPEIAKTKAKLEREVASRTQRRRIQRDFEAKISFLETEGLLPTAQARVLKKLHQYRNEAYHRDTLRLDTLASSVRIYSYLVCQMMRDFPVHMMNVSARTPPEPLRRYLGDDVGLLDFDLQARIASALLEQTGFESPSDLAEVSLSSRSRSARRDA